MIKKNMYVKTWTPAQRPKRLTKISILIVCEDSNYSQKYFNAIKNRYRLNNIDIPVRKAVGKSLQQLLDWAIDFHREKDKKYDEIYFIFDKDMHPDYQQVLNAIKKFRLKSRNGKLVKIAACVAIPCFEYWLILHLVETNKPFLSSNLLKKEWKKLCNKTYPDLNSEEIFYKITEPTTLLKAIERAKKSQKNLALTTGNPSTDIYMLIERLITLVDRFDNELSVIERLEAVI